MSTIPTTSSPEAVAGVRTRAKAVSAGQGIQLTEKAAAKVGEILKQGDYPATMYLFVGVKGGGCSGLQYVLDLRDETHAPVADTDEVFLSHDVPVVCDLKSFVVGNLDGTIIDYQETLTASGFTFNNPNARHSCGCGSSYSA